MANSGNTIGRVVGESGAANVSATGANPPITPETEAEAKSGGGWLDALQIGLDVVGLIPGVGEIADLANAGISAARGDYVGAGLSLAAAIPFAGWGATGAKAVKRGVDIAQTGAKAAGEAGIKAGKELIEEGAEQAAKHADEAADAAKNGGKVKGTGNGAFDRCKALAATILTKATKLQSRIDDLLIDHLDLFNKARHKPGPETPKGSGSWDGHIHQADGVQRGLRNAINAYDAAGCKSPRIPKSLRTLAYADLPSKPRGR